MDHKEGTLSSIASMGLSEKDLPTNTRDKNIDSNDVLPSVNATPKEVRDFMTRLLANRRGLLQDHVRRAVAKWIVGTEQELRSYSPSMYLDLFQVYRAAVVLHQGLRFTYFERFFILAVRLLTGLLYLTIQSLEWKYQQVRTDHNGPLSEFTSDADSLDSLNISLLSLSYILSVHIIMQ
jgi:hypothetical protein